jgi:histidine triad (HIT) family protein
LSYTQVKEIEMAECIFCKIIEGEIPCFKVYEDDWVLSFADINPMAEGHTLIIPKKHVRNLWEIDEQSLIAIHLASIRIIKAMRESLQPTGVAALQLNGEGAGQEVDHYHLHLIPRLKDMPPLPVARWKITPGDMDKIRGTAEKIRSAIE